jgi:hypothetical protein
MDQWRGCPTRAHLSHLAKSRVNIPPRIPPIPTISNHPQVRRSSRGVRSMEDTAPHQHIHHHDSSRTVPEAGYPIRIGVRRSHSHHLNRGHTLIPVFSDRLPQRVPSATRTAIDRTTPLEEYPLLRPRVTISSEDTPSHLLVRPAPVRAKHRLVQGIKIRTIGICGLTGACLVAKGSTLALLQSPRDGQVPWLDPIRYDCALAPWLFTLSPKCAWKEVFLQSRIHDPHRAM